MSLSFLKLSTVLPDVTSVTVRGETFKLRRFNLRQIKEAKNCIGFFMQLKGELDGKTPSLRDILEIVLHSAEPAIILAATTAEKPIEWAEQLGPEEIVPLLLACVEVNTGFFSKAFLPKMAGWTKRINKLLTKA